MVALKARQIAAFLGAWRRCGACCELLAGCRIGGDVRRIWAEGTRGYARARARGGVLPSPSVCKIFFEKPWYKDKFTHLTGAADGGIMKAHNKWRVLAHR